MTIAEKILKFTKSVYPRGRAWKMADGSYHEALHRALAKSESRAYSDSEAILFSILPDNDQFSVDDATDWERRLGLISNASVSLAIRKQAILRKMNHPGTIKARQHYLYIQGQLQAAGFNVYVHENLFPDGLGGWLQYTPQDVLEGNYGQYGDFQMGFTQYGDSISANSTLFVWPQYGNFQMGDFQYNGYVYKNKIVNNIDEDLDQYFDWGLTLRSTFFIGGEVFGTFANVDENRKAEFRQLILKLKPVQSVGFLLINYV